MKGVREEEEEEEDGREATFQVYTHVEKVEFGIANEILIEYLTSA